MNIDDGRIIARFQRLTTELLVGKRLGQWHPSLILVATVSRSGAVNAGFIGSINVTAEAIASLH